MNFDINKFESWPGHLVQSPLSPTDLARFQMKLNNAVGVEPDGTVRARFVWAMDFEKTKIWDRYENAWHFRYWSHRMKIARTNPATGLSEVALHYFGTPRYVYEVVDPRWNIPSMIDKAGFDTELIGDEKGNLQKVTTDAYSERK